MLFEKTTYSDDFPINIKIAKITEYPLHYHKDVEFIYVLKGEVRLKCVCSGYLLSEGDIFTNNSREVHALTATDKENIVAIIQISTRYFTQYFPDLHKACFMTYVNNSKYPKLDTLRKLLLHILLDFSQRSFNYKSTCIYQMIDVIRYLNQNFNLFAFDDNVVTDFRDNNPVIVDRISRIINYIYENHAEKITLDDLARKEHLSTFYLSHFIRDHMGISFQEFLCFARVEMSEIPLLQTNRKISVIAKDVGFSATSYYEKFFIKWFGHTPEEHRALFLPHVLSSEKPALLDVLSENQSIGLLKRCLSAVSDYERSPSLVSKLYLNVDVLPKVTPVMELKQDLSIIITCEDYHIMGERLFNMLYELRASKVILSLSQQDSETTATLIENRLNFMGYEVSSRFENGLRYSPSSGCDTIAAAIDTFQKYFDPKENSLQCRLRDQGNNPAILKGLPGVLTSGLIPKPSFYAFRLLQNIKGKLLYWGKYYYVVKNESSDSYVIIVLNYNDEIRHLTERSAGIYETNDIINTFRNELNLDFSIPVGSGQYIIAKYALTNDNSIFSHLSHLGFPNSFSLSDAWLHQLSTEPQTQVDIECIKDKLNISVSLTGAAINVIAVSPVNES